MDKYLQDISRDRRYWERKREEVRRERNRLNEISEKYQSELEEIDRKRKEILAQAKLQAEQLIAESNAKIESTIRQIRRPQARQGENQAGPQVAHRIQGEHNRSLRSAS